MWRANILGRQSQVELRVGAFLNLVDETQDRWRTARIEKVNPSKSIAILIDRPSSWPQGGQTHAIIYINHNKNNSFSDIRIEESGIPSQHLEEVKNYWSRRINYFRGLVSKVNQRRKQVRQAVVVIHGIGEQKPGETLYGLADSCNGSRLKTVGLAFNAILGSN